MIPLCKCTTFSLSAHQLMEWNLDCTNGLSWSLTVPSLSCSTWPFLDFKPSTPWGNLLTHYQVQLQYKTQPFSSLENSFIIVSENTSQKISPQCSWSLLTPSLLSHLHLAIISCPSSPFILDSKTRATWPNFSSSTAWWVINMAPLFYKPFTA